MADQKPADTRIEGAANGAAIQGNDPGNRNHPSFRSRDRPNVLASVCPARLGTSKSFAKRIERKRRPRSRRIF